MNYGLVNCHIMVWSKIVSNTFGVKFFPLLQMYYVAIEEIIYMYF